MKDGLYWWRAAIAGLKPAVTTEVQPGFFLMKVTLARGSDNEHTEMWPASIWWEGPTDEDGNPCGDQVLCAEVGGKEASPDDIWLSVAKRPVERSEYEFWLGKLVEREL